MSNEDISGIIESGSGSGSNEIINDASGSSSGSDQDISGIDNTKTHAEKMLEAIEAVLEGRLLDEYKTLKIGNREITKHTFDELRRLRDYYRGEVARQKARKNGKFKSYRYRF